MKRPKPKSRGIRTDRTDIKANNQRIEALEAKIKANEININMLLSRSVEPKAKKGKTKAKSIQPVVECRK